MGQKAIPTADAHRRVRGVINVYDRNNYFDAIALVEHTFASPDIFV